MITGQPLPALSRDGEALHRALRAMVGVARVEAPALGGRGPVPVSRGRPRRLRRDLRPSRATTQDGKTVLADLKTGKGVYREASLQLAAYGAAELVSPMGSQDVYPMPAVDRYDDIHVTREGVRAIEVAVGASEWAAWWACLDLYRWTETVKGRL